LIIRPIYSVLVVYSPIPFLNVFLS